MLEGHIATLTITESKVSLLNRRALECLVQVNCDISDCRQEEVSSCRELASSKSRRKNLDDLK